jgi:hypothetical protein
LLTLFASPKPFRGHAGVIQRNAVRSWTRLKPRPEIILLGDEEGISQTAVEFGVRHVSGIHCTEFGAPLLDDLFAKARQAATFELLAYVNADIILLDDFMTAAERVRHWRSRFLMVGRRWDIDIREEQDFAGADWANRLKTLVQRSGKQRGSDWIDYFVFSKDLTDGLLPFAIGRTVWDNWLIWHARDMKLPVVDASLAVTAVHQNHDYSHHVQGHDGVWRGKEAQRNRALIGGWWRHYTTGDATYLLSSTRIEPNLRHWVAKLNRAGRNVGTSIWFGFLDFTRPIRQRLGLRKRVNPT